MRAIICGGRDFDDEIWMWKRLETIHAAHPITEVIEGGNRGVTRDDGWKTLGADQIAMLWALSHAIPVLTVHARWVDEGPAAGPIRNRRMADLKPDVVIYAPGGRGTDSMRAIAKEKGIRCISLAKVQPPPWDIYIETVSAGAGPAWFRTCVRARRALAEGGRNLCEAVQLSWQMEDNNRQRRDRMTFRRAFNT